MPRSCSWSKLPGDTKAAGLQYTSGVAEVQPCFFKRGPQNSSIAWGLGRQAHSQALIPKLLSLGQAVCPSVRVLSSSAGFGCTRGFENPWCTRALVSAAPKTFLPVSISNFPGQPAPSPRIPQRWLLHSGAPSTHARLQSPCQLPARQRRVQPG